MNKRWIWFGSETEMSRHSCPRCGLESSRDTWAERHPVATVLIALPTLYTLVGVILAYPWFFVPLFIVAAAVWVDRQQRRRAALAARADYEHRVLVARAVLRRPSPLPPVRRPADHWSTTQPIRTL